MSPRSPRSLTVLRPLGRPAPPLVRWLALPCTKCLCCFPVFQHYTPPNPSPAAWAAFVERFSLPAVLDGWYVDISGGAFESSFSSVGPLQGHESKVSCVELAGLLNVDESFPEVAQMLYQVSKRPRRGRQGNDVRKVGRAGDLTGTERWRIQSYTKGSCPRQLPGPGLRPIVARWFWVHAGGHVVGSFGGRVGHSRPDSVT